MRASPSSSILAITCACSTRWRRMAARPRRSFARSSPPRPLPAPALTTPRSARGSPRPWATSRLERRVIAGTLVDALRYGENPHQWGAFYRTSDTRFGVATATQVQGKELSYNNLNDADAAYELVAEFDPNVTRRGRHHQACQSVRRGHRFDAEAGLHQGARAAILRAPSAASSRSTAASTPMRRGRSSRSSPR